MNYTEKVNEQEKAITELYEKAQKSLSKVRLQATLYDTAQAILDIERPGEEVAEIVIGTNTAMPLSETLKKTDEALAEAEAALENAKKQPATKTVYTIRYCTLGGEVSTAPLANPRKIDHDTIESAFEELNYLRENHSTIGTRYFIESRQVEA